MNVNELVDKRILITEKRRYGEEKVVEIKITEISPSGNWAKIMNQYGSKYWRLVTSITLVEELTDLKAGKPDV